jgi:hypothetical protein
MKSAPPALSFLFGLGRRRRNKGRSRRRRKTRKRGGGERRRYVEMTERKKND